MSKSKKGQSIQGPLIIKIETFPKSGKKKRCFADCNEKCPRKSYTNFDPKPPRRKSKSEDEHFKESAEYTQSSEILLLTNQKEHHFQSSLEASEEISIHSQQQKYLSDYEELSAVEIEQPLHTNNTKNSKDSEILIKKKNCDIKNINENMTRSSETPYEEYKNSDQRISEMRPNELMTPEAKNSIIQYCKPNIEMEKQCLCSDFSKGQNTDIMSIPKKLLRPCNKNGIKFCNKKLDQETNPDYTIEISVELAQNKKKKASQIEPKQKQAGIADPNETARSDENYNKSPKYPTRMDQNDNYIDEKPKYPDPSKQQRVDYPTKIAKISDRRTLTARQPNSINQPEEISISVDTSRVEISTDEGKQTLLTNKRTTTIRSSYAEWDADETAEQPKALMDSSDRGSVRSTGQKSVSSQRKPFDPQFSGYNSDQDDGSRQYLQYKENEIGRDEQSDKLQKKLFTQNEQIPGKSSRDSPAKSIGSKQIEGSLYKRTTKMRTDGDINQPDKFSVISEVEEGELYLTPESRKTPIASEADPYMAKLFEQEQGTVKPYRHLSKELDEVMDPDQWSFDEQDIVEKRRNLFERARALSAGLLERARSLSAAAKSEREHESIPPTTKRGIVSSGEEPEDYSQRGGEKIRNIGASTFSPEMELQSRGTYRPLQSAPPSAKPIFRNIAVSTFSPPMSLASFVERNQQGSKGGRLVVSPHSDRYGTPGTMEGDIQSKVRETPLQSSPLSTPPRGYPTSQEQSHVGEDASSRHEYPDGYPSSGVPSQAGSRERYPGVASTQPDGYPTSGLPSRAGSKDIYPTGGLVHPDGSRASEPPSGAGSRDRYPGGSSGYPDGYPSNVPSRAGSRDTYPGSSSVHPDGYRTSEFPSRVGSKDLYPGGSSARPDGYRSNVPSRAGSQDRYPEGSTGHRDGYQSNVPSRAGSRDRYSEGPSAHPDEYQTSGVPSRAGSKDTYRSSSHPDGYQSNVPSRAGSRDRYSEGPSAHPDEYQTSGVPSRAGSKDTYRSSSHPDGYQSNVPSRAGSREEYHGGSTAHSDGFKTSEVPSRAGSRDTFTAGSLAHPDGYQSNVPSRAGSREEYHGGSTAHSAGFRTSEVPSRAGSRDTYRSSSHPDGYQSNVPSRAGSREEYHGGSTAHSDGFKTSEVPSRAGSRDTFTAGSLAHPDGYQSNVPSRAGSREPSSRYPSVRSEVGSSTTIDDVKGPPRKLSDGIAAPQIHLPYRDFGVSTTSPMSFDSHIEGIRRSRISSPAVSVQPIAQREPDISSTIKSDYESQGSHRPTDSVLVSEEAEEYPESETTPSYATKEDATKAAIFQPYATIVPLKEYPKSGCFLELCVLEKHVDGCLNKRKVGEEHQFCGYDVLSRQIFQTCQESSVPLMLEEEFVGKSAVGSLQSGRKRPDSSASTPIPTEELISETRATPVYSEKKSVTASESTESYAPSEVTSVKEDEDERLKREAQAKAEEEERLRKEALRKEEEAERLRRADLRKEEEEERLKRAAALKKAEDEKPRRTSSETKTSRGGSDKDKSDDISDTGTVVSSVTSKKSSFSGHLPDFRNMPVKPAPIDRKPTSVFSKWLKNLPCKLEKKEKKEENKDENKEENTEENKT